MFAMLVDFASNPTYIQPLYLQPTFVVLCVLDFVNVTLMMVV